MRKRIQRTLGPMEVIAVDGGPSTTVNGVDRSAEWRGLVPRALGKAGVSHKAAAVDMAIDPGLLSAQLSGVPGKHLSWLRMGSLPPAFWRELIVLIAEFHDITIGTTPRDTADAAVGRLVREIVGRCR
jgi:hypothetical protein